MNFGRPNLRTRINITQILFEKLGLFKIEMFSSWILVCSVLESLVFKYANVLDCIGKTTSIIYKNVQTLIFIKISYNMSVPEEEVRRCTCIHKTVFCYYCLISSITTEVRNYKILFINTILCLEIIINSTHETARA